MDGLFSEFDSADSPGCLLGIIRNGEYVYENAYGMADLKNGIPLEPETVIYIASVAKQFVAASVLVAEDEGYLSLDDDIRKYLPEMPVYEDAISIGDLIHHTSGIRDFFTLKWLANLEWPGGFDAPDEKEALASLTRQGTLNFPPGTGWAYTTSNYELLGHIVERATGKSVWAYAQAKLFEPLGMSDTQLHHDRAPGARGYLRRGDEYEPADVDDRRGAYTTLDDFLVWDRYLYESGSRLRTPGTLKSGEEVPYAFGLKLGEYRGLSTESHDGAFKGFRPAYIRFPDRSLSVVCLCNMEVRASELASRVADIYLTDESGWEPQAGVNLSEEELQRFTGAYLSPAGWVLNLRVADGSLEFFSPERTNPLTPLDSTRFRSPSFGNNQYRFFREEPEGPWHFEVLLGVAGSVPTHSLTFRPIKLSSPSRSELESYAGVYVSEEVPATYSIVLEQSELMLERGSELPALELRAITEEIFAVDGKGTTLEFVRDHEGGVSALRLTAPGAWNLRFARKN